MRRPKGPGNRRFEFSKKSIAALPDHDQDSPSRECEYSDSGCTGLRLRVSKGGRKFFQHRFVLHGRKRCLTLGEFSSEFGPMEARKLVAEQRAAMAMGDDPAAEKTRLREEPTFDEFAAGTYMPHARLHKRTASDDERMIRRTLSPAWGKKRMSAITFDDVVRLQGKEQARTSACSANHVLALTKRMLALAVKSGVLARNPAADVTKLKEKPNRERYLSLEELPRFLSALDEDSEDRLSVAAIKLLLYTGCRRGEVVTLQWPQVRLDEQRLYLSLTKNGTSRSVHLNEKAYQILQDLSERRDECERAKKSQYVFPSRQGARKGHLFDLRKPLQKACQAAGIKGLRLHDLRHSFAALALASGASLYDVQILLGHKDISVTQRYSHLSADHLRRATANVATLVGQVSSAS